MAKRVVDYAMTKRRALCLAAMALEAVASGNKDIEEWRLAAAEIRQILARIRAAEASGNSSSGKQ